MGHHHKLRTENDCLNCGAIVEDRFCPHCGQENIERRQPFHFLIGHFMEDLTHYDGQFWITMKALLFNPGQLTQTYLSGKRLKYVNPVKLYIFISFIAFFLPAIIPDFSHKKHHDEKEEKKVEVKKVEDEKGINGMKVLLDKKLISKSDFDQYVVKMNNTMSHDSLVKKQSKNEVSEEYYNLDQSIIKGATTQEEYDKIQAGLPPSEKNNYWQNIVAAKIFSWKEEGLTKKEVNEKWKESFVHNFPKVIFVYMPLFAFLLWLLENKKKFWYFDASIFTLHFFSFLLTAITTIIILQKLFSGFSYGIFTIILILYSVVICFYTIRYFFKAHHRVFFQSRRRVFLKGVVLFFINFIFMLFFVVAYAIIIGYRIH
ncbi:DUF3667 domain-containing protein [Rhizosphaericola mali]|uniref:DUF3667 domain-containing protein n=1 Tax=Rhizosphaericola mali TaxID=2545455 RepID=A0A5P2G5M5_9BACT|nr:DUF3667 domain-containing protein [Rhizosphaericola mali]QES89060.1 DUF3667 domain-containing protein [Rhizosphaericola mali]